MTLLLLLLASPLSSLLVPTAAADPLVDVGPVEISNVPEDAVADARAKLQAGRFDEAATLYGALADAGGGVPARVAQAVAAYEAGDLRAARKAAEAAIAADPKSLAAGNILGLILVDGGDVAGGIARLEATRKAAAAAGATGVEARATANLALASLDGGDIAGTGALIEKAADLATKAGDQAVLDALSETRSALAALSGSDTGVGQLLGKGDVKGARSRAEADVRAATGRRDKILAAIQLAAVDRAEGNLDGAAGRLEQAVKDARASGMQREVAVALGQLGLVYSLGGKQRIAADTLVAGANEAAKGGYKVVEVDLRCELGVTLVHLDRVPEAVTQQGIAGRLLGAMDYPQGVARQAELGGMIAAAQGDIKTATAALSRAADHHAALGRNLDAARAATALAAALRPTDPAGADRAAERAKGYFKKAGEPLGPAHIALALALADARAKNLGAALQGFATAAELAEKVGGGRAQAIASVAREDAAQTLVMLGSDQDLARLAAENGISDLLAREQTLQQAFSAYDEGLRLYQAGQWKESLSRFAASRKDFESLSETAYAMRARRAAAWAAYNQNVGLPTAQAWPNWNQLVEEAARLDEPELYARTYSASVLAAANLGQKDLGIRLNECIRLATIAGLPEVAARCHGSLAEAEGDIEKRAQHARTAWQLAPKDNATLAALYAVAVDAYNAGRNDIAGEMAKLALPIGGQVKGQLEEIIAASAG